MVMLRDEFDYWTSFFFPFMNYNLNDFMAIIILFF